MARPKRTGFENKTQGYLGAVKLNRKGEPEGIAVGPGERVFLTDEEIQLTDEAPARAEDSPFREKEIVHFDPDTGDEIARFVAAPLSRATRAPAATSARSRPKSQGTKAAAAA